MEKLCKKCLKEKDVSNFNKHPETKDRLSNYCRECKNEKQRIFREISGNKHTKSYEKTEHGFIMRLYRNMKSRIDGVQKKNTDLYVGKCLLDKNVFYGWALNNMEFKRLFVNYTESGYSRKLAPSVDRINSKEGYDLSNMEFVTMSENSRRGSLSRNKKYGFTSKTI